MVPGAPAYSRPISHRMSATLSPMAGVGARDRSTIPKGTSNILEASWATSCPTLVTLKAVLLMVSHSTSKFSPRTFSRAVFTTPGPLTPTLMTLSASVTPWKAPAMNGLSSGALQNTTSFAQPRESLSFVYSAVDLTISPMSLTASMLMPVLVEPRFTEAHTRSVAESASGMERSSSSSAVIPLLTSAEYPPMKFTPTSFATRSRVPATAVKSSTDRQAAPATRATGVTDMRLFTIGTPNSLDISSPMLTRFLAASYIFV